jgi:hypothetical protein
MKQGNAKSSGRSDIEHHTAIGLARLGEHPPSRSGRPGSLVRAKEKL